LGLTLFQRGKRKPILTPAGLAVLAYARRLCQLTDELTASASSLTAGLEGQFVLGVDTFFPEGQLAAALADLAESLPSVSIDVRVRSRDQVLRLVMDGQAALGVGAVDIAWPAGIEAGISAAWRSWPSWRRRMRWRAMSAAFPPAPCATACRSPTGPRATKTRHAMSRSTPRVCGAWAACRCRWSCCAGGLGWGYLPVHVAQAQIHAGHLAQLDPATRRRGVQPWSLMYRAAKPPGPAGRLLMERLEHHARDQEI
jgi:DNA-binding transcriptional LysR family regulator